MADKSTEIDEPAVVELLDLPQELTMHILRLLPATILAQISSSCSDWHSNIVQVASGQLQVLLPGSHICPRPLRQLAAVQEFTSAVGNPPISRTWRDEWPTARLKHARQLAKARGPNRLVEYDAHIEAMGEGAQIYFTAGQGSIENATEHYRSSIQFKQRNDVASAWPEDASLSASLLSALCACALSEAVQQRERDLAASCWALCAAFWRRSWYCDASSAIPPPCYCHLDGEFGLATHDVSWEAVRGMGSCAGRRFITRGFCFSMPANSNSFPDGRGYHVPVRVHSGVTYELAHSDVVKIVSAPSDKAACRSSLPTDEDVFRLPPGVIVTLERVWEPGEWQPREGVAAVERRCFEVSVEF